MAFSPADAPETAVYLANRAACHHKLVRPFRPPVEEGPYFLSRHFCSPLAQDRFDACVADCTAALKVDPAYLKALWRRAAAYERLDRLDDALAGMRGWGTVMWAMGPPPVLLRIPPGRLPGGAEP